jgi:hypothetical protein
VKRKTEEQVKASTQAWRDLQKIIEEYHKRDRFSEILVNDLEALSKSYQEAVFAAVVEGTK